LTQLKILLDSKLVCLIVRNVFTNLFQNDFEFYMTDVIPIVLGERSYNIYVGFDLLANAGQILRSLLTSSKLFIVTDKNVESLHLKVLKDSFNRAGFNINCIVLPVGEESKSFSQLERLVDIILEMHCERNDTIVALGGGVIGDLSGFVASILLRGISLVQIPTTLLSQVDSSIGGKTGINTRHGKNLIGSFYHPIAVLSDLDVLNTMPIRELKAGYAEIVKYSLINDSDFFFWLEKHGVDVLTNDKSAILHAVLFSCRSKARIVTIDERESGQRALLNLGHTFAHALEVESGYSEFSHGEAVSIGLVLAFNLSVALGFCFAIDRDRLINHLKNVGLPITLPPLQNNTWSSERLMSHFNNDKKVNDGRVTFVLTKGIGQVFLSSDVPVDLLRTVLDTMIRDVGENQS
jgi:3-dehydroquinate synthase